MHIGIYTRKSRLSEKGESISNQIAICKEYCHSFPNPVFTIYEDEGYSGGDTLRPGYHQMIADIQKGQLQAVVCYRLDRISRSVSDFSNTLTLLNQHQVAFLSVKERFDTSTPMGRAMMYISSVFAQLERETIAERLQDNLRRLSQTGRWLGGITPVGFDAQRKSQTDANGVERTYCFLIPNQEEVSIVQLFYQQYLACKSLQGVLEYAKKNQIKTRKNAPYCSRSLKHILTNPVYVKSNPALYDYYASLGCKMVSPKEQYKGSGLHIHGRYEKNQKKQTTHKPEEWSMVVGYHEGLIEPDLFLQVQQLLFDNKNKPSRSQTSKTALLSGLIVCPLCGSPMLVSYKTPTVANGKIHYYYRCRKKTKSKGQLCNMENINGKQADSLVLDALESICQDNNQHICTLLARLSQQLDMSENESQKKRRQLEEKIKNLSCHLAENQDSAAAKFILAQMEKYANQLSALESQAAAIHVPFPTDKQAAATALVAEHASERDIRRHLDYIRSPKLWPLAEQKKLVTSIITEVYPLENILHIRTNER